MPALSPEATADALLHTFLSPASDSAPATWSDAYADAVRARRRAAGPAAQLLVDRLLAEAGVDGTPSAAKLTTGALFPPTSPSAAYVLLVAVLTSPTATQAAKHGIVYYLALEHDGVQTAHGAPRHADAFTLARHIQLEIPVQLEVDSYWAMDHQLYEVRHPRSFPLTAARNAWPSVRPLCPCHRIDARCGRAAPGAPAIRCTWLPPTTRRPAIRGRD